MTTKKTTESQEEPVVATETIKQIATEKPQETEEKSTKTTAKAGKRSEKATKEAEEKAAKEERKAKGDTTPQEGAEVKVAQKQNKTRTRLERRGKNYRKAAETIEKNKAYTLKEAVGLAANASVGKFDATIELHVNLNVDPRQADQNLRGTVVLPHGTGKTVRVAAFVGSDHVASAKKAGADVAGEEEVLALLDKQQFDFDVLISTPQLMAKLGKYARVLGPRGLMPNPKSGTVTANPAKAIEEAKAGRVEYRVDKQSIVHLGVGKQSFGADKLYDNAKAFFSVLTANKPASIKGALIKGVSTSATMGPGVKVDISSL